MAHEEQIKKLKKLIKENEKELKDLETGPCQCPLTAEAAVRMERKIRIRKKELKLLEEMP